jgi:hypothetical membrane protein
VKERTPSVVAGLSGIGAVLVYVAGTVLGGRLRPQYSHRSQAISELTEAGAPHREVLARFYLAYNLLLGVFATGVFVSSERSRLFRVGWALQLVNGGSGLLQVTALRMDPIGAPLTRAGIGHFVGAGLSSLCTVLGTMIFGIASRSDAFWRPLAPFSVASGIAIVVTGVPAAVSATKRSRVMGLWERGTIGLFLLWVLVLSAYALIRRPGAAKR